VIDQRFSIVRSNSALLTAYALPNQDILSATNVIISSQNVVKSAAGSPPHDATVWMPTFKYSTPTLAYIELYLLDVENGECSFLHQIVYTDGQPVPTSLAEN